MEAPTGSTQEKRKIPDGTGVVDLDPWLSPFKDSLRHRFSTAQRWIQKLNETEGGLEKFSRGYERFGFNVLRNGEITYREWAPNAEAAELVVSGDDNKWDLGSYQMQKDPFGVWEVIIPAKDGAPAIGHNSKVKIVMKLPNGEYIHRLPAWIKRVTQELSVSPVYDARFWNPPKKYQFRHQRPKKPRSARVYEAHVGISTPEAKVGTYKEFTVNVLPRIKKLGYNVLQLMAVMEHAYYASFGYQITSFFAVSSRYGEPEDLKELIDTAHGMGISVFLDVVHSHACNNVLDGLNMFDGTDHLYFHGGPKGRHELWDSRLFNYGSHEVLRFLLSNLRFYIEEYQFDGFRFDGVTSILYTHHGIGTYVAPGKASCIPY
ncbi:hypothetical protein ABW19_dt0206043 [Dactylella cylindrospora]|nr:hypothetical protein ABW19_dt0206043 [Dactylella cylindrospora]